MPGGLFARVKTWITKEALLYTDLNAEFDNIIAKLIPTYLDCYSHTAAEMKLQTDPGALGSESLATALSGELERLRFALARLQGTTYWYQAPATTLSVVNTLLSAAGSIPTNRVVSGRARTGSNQAMALVPDGTAATVNLKGATTSFSYYIQGTLYTISTDITSTGLTLAPSSNNTCLVNDTSLAAGVATKVQGEVGVYGPWNGGSITIDTVGSNISALIGKIAAFKVGATEYFIAYVESATKLSRCYRGFFFDSADAPIVRLAISNNDTITLMKLTWVFATTAGALAVTYTNPLWQGTTPSSPASGDYWYDTVNTKWMTYNGSSWIAANATLVGVCIQDTAGCKAARSLEYFANYDNATPIYVEIESNTNVRSSNLGATLNVAGSLIKADGDFFRWNTTDNLDTGVTIGNSTTYFLYVTNTGKTIISDKVPFNRYADMLGLYHPHHTWRAVGAVATDGSAHFTSIISYERLDGTQLNDISVGFGKRVVRTLVTNGTGTAVGDLVRSNSDCGGFLNAAAALTDVTNLTLTIVTNGGPVRLWLAPKMDTAGYGSLASGNGNGWYLHYLNTTNTHYVEGGAVTSTGQNGVPAPVIDTSVAGVPGTYTYKLQVINNGGASPECRLYFLHLWAEEIA